MSIIKVEGLTKDYGNGKGIFNLNFEIRNGQAFGYLGPNGAGKSTTIRHLLGFLNADKGKCSIGGLDCRTQSEQIHKSLGYLSGEIAFFDDMTGKEFLDYMARLRGMSDRTEMNELIDFFELDISGKLKKMSKGMKQKIGLVNAFMHNPETLILDEPTSGLDPLMQNKFVELIRKEKAEGKTILMSSHSFEEVEKTCDRVGIIKEGKFVADSSVDELIKTQRKLFEVSFSGEKDKDSFINKGFEVVYTHGNTLKIAVTGDVNPLIRELSAYDIKSISSEKQNLEDIFMGYYGGNHND